MIKGIIFDKDGVLIDSIDAHYSAWSKFLKSKGFSKFNKKIYLTFMGIQTKEIIESMGKKYGFKVHLEKDALLKETFVDASKYKIFRDTKKTLKALKKNYKIAMATSAIKRETDMQVSKFDLKKYFDTIITVEKVKISKPNPELFLKAAKGLGLKPKECVVVEDAVAGIEAANRAGMKSIAITTTLSKSKLIKSNPTIILKSINKIDSKLINNL